MDEEYALDPDELRIWDTAFRAQLKNCSPIHVATSYANEALDAYMEVRARSFLEAEDGECHCPGCAEVRDQAKRKAN